MIDSEPQHCIVCREPCQDSDQEVEEGMLHDDCVEAYELRHAERAYEKWATGDA